MKSIIALLACVAFAAAAPFLDNSLDETWSQYKNIYEKSYIDINAETMRRVIWEKNLKIVKEHNLKADMGLHTYWLGMNEFADLTNKEFVKMMNGLKPRNASLYTPNMVFSDESMDLPATVDWREKGYVTKVKNQGQCGSCWAFSATGSLEGQTFKKTGNLPSLSEQNLVDCSISYGNNGCEGGLMDLGFKYIKGNGGIDSEESYPYEAQDDDCRFKKSDVAATVTGFVDVKAGSEDDLKSAVAKVGPISVAIDAGHSSFQLYTHGVYSEEECSSTALDHGVLAVGYGTENGKDFWLVKNSWGPSWGMNGYIKMTRNQNNMCGIATQASYPLI